MFPDPGEKLFEARTVLVHGPIRSATVSAVTAQLLTLAAGALPITIYLNAPGGEAEAAEALYDVVRFATAPVRIVATGAVEGAAVLVYTAVPRAARYSLPHARFSLRQPRAQARTDTDPLAAAEEAERRRQRLVETLAHATGQPSERLEEDLRRGGFLRASEARAYGLVGHIIARLDELPAA